METAREVYLWAAGSCDVVPERMALVAAHGWDVLGAQRAGLTGAWFPRSERVYPAVYEPPHVTGADLAGVVDGLLALPGMITEVDTPLGPARAHVTDGGTIGTLVLGHGAGGGIESADLVEVTTEAAAAGWRVVRVEQPWRVAGRRIAPAPPRLDEGWRAVLAALRADGMLTGPLVLGGRSAGARVACRTAAEQGAAGVLALAFPLHPPGRPEKCRARGAHRRDGADRRRPGRDGRLRRPEDVAAVLAGRGNASVYAVAGDHALKKDVHVVAAAAMSWLGRPVLIRAHRHRVMRTRGDHRLMATSS